MLISSKFVTKCNFLWAQVCFSEILIYDFMLYYWLSKYYLSRAKLKLSCLNRHNQRMNPWRTFWKTIFTRAVQQSIDKNKGWIWFIFFGLGGGLITGVESDKEICWNPLQPDMEFCIILLQAKIGNLLASSKYQWFLAYFKWYFML